MSDISIFQERKEVSASFARSQLILFQSRMKWGIVYCLATIAGIFLVPSSLGVVTSESEIVGIVHRIAPLPIISLLITTGMFLLNDILDVELDRANGKKRPLPLGQVTKRQGWIFIIWTNAAAVLLAVITANPMSMVLVVPMLAIGILYSAPKIALDDRFVVKTTVIALYYVLCAALGFTALYSIDSTIINPAVIVLAVIVLGGMRFISSVLNDTGDVEGDTAAGRRTIPIVIGKENTVKVMMVIASGMVLASVAFYAVEGIGLTLALSTGATAGMLVRRLNGVLKGVRDRDFVRNQHKKLLPFDLLFLACLSAGVLLM
jgi:geranylgeranylglycerol-phosphate geranylgeranyltransferase